MVPMGSSGSHLAALALTMSPKSALEQRLQPSLCGVFLDLPVPPFPVPKLGKLILGEPLDLLLDGYDSGHREPPRSAMVAHRAAQLTAVLRACELPAAQPSRRRAARPRIARVSRSSASAHENPERQAAGEVDGERSPREGRAGDAMVPAGEEVAGGE